MNQLDKIMPKLFKVKSKMTGVVKDSKNPFFKSQYADLNAHLEMIEPLLSENGLVLLQPVTSNNGQDVVSSVIYDSESGQSVTSSISINGKDMQSLGAAVTYGRRFTLGSLLGMQAVDDDGNFSSGKVDKLVNTSKTSPIIVQSSPTTATIQNTSDNRPAPPKPTPSFKRPQAKPVTQSTGDDL